CSGHYDLFHDWMVDCKACNSRFRVDQVMIALAVTADGVPFARESYEHDPTTGMGLSSKKNHRLEQAERQYLRSHPNEVVHRQSITLEEFGKRADGSEPSAYNVPDFQPRCPRCDGELTEPREFNLMFETHTGALRNDENKTFLRPETAQGIFV